MRLKQRRNLAFTLIELLVVIAIIALLLSIVMPALRKVKEQARKVVCASNLSQVGKALETYEMTYDYKRFEMRKNGSETDAYWWGKLAPFFGNTHYEKDIKKGKVIDVPPTVPLFGCGTWTASWPMGTDLAPTDLQGGAGGGMVQFCIARHGRAVNVIFKDLHAESTKQLEDLWYYRWHKDYEAPPIGTIVLPSE